MNYYSESINQLIEELASLPEYWSKIGSETGVSHFEHAGKKSGTTGVQHFECQEKDLSVQKMF